MRRYILPALVGGAAGAAVGYFTDYPLWAACLAGFGAWALIRALAAWPKAIDEGRKVAAARAAIQEARAPASSQLLTGHDDLDTAAFERLRMTGRCPDCSGVLTEGPRGGASVNVRCDACGNKFNIASFRGVLVMAHRI